MEQNNQYKQSTFKPNIDNDTSINNLVNYIAATHKKAEPSSIAHQKTAHINPFGMISESIFGQAASAAKKLSGAAMASATPSLNINARSAQSNAQAQMAGPIQGPFPYGGPGSAPPQTSTLPGGTTVTIPGRPSWGTTTSTPSGTPSSTSSPASATPTSASASAGGSTPTATSMGTSSSSPDDVSDADLVDALRGARGMPKGDRGGLGNKGRGEAERARNQAERAARNEALRAAGTDAQRRREKYQDELNAMRKEREAAQKALDAAQKAKDATRREEAGPTPDGKPAVTYGSQESKDYDKALADFQAKQQAIRDKSDSLRKFNERTGKFRKTQFGNTDAIDIALRYPDESTMKPEERPLSPFYNISRSEFERIFGVPWTGSTPENMQRLLAWKNGNVDAIQSWNPQAPMVNTSPRMPAPPPPQPPTPNNPNDPKRARNRKERNEFYP